MAEIPPGIQALPPLHASQERTRMRGQAEGILRRFAAGVTAPSDAPIKGGPPVSRRTDRTEEADLAGGVPAPLTHLASGATTLGALTDELDGTTPRKIDRSTLQEDGWHPREVLDRGGKAQKKSSLALAAGAVAKLKNARG